MSYKIGQVVAFRVETSDIRYSPFPVATGVVLSEEGLAHGADPHETIEIVLGWEADLSKPLEINRVRVAWEPDELRKAVNTLEVDCCFVRTIPRKWITRKQGKVSTEGLKQIEEGVRAFL